MEGGVKVTSCRGAWPRPAKRSRGARFRRWPGWGNLRGHQWRSSGGHRGTADAIEQCFTVFSRRTSAQWILEGDIRGCFDNFSHSWFVEHVPMDKTILRRWLEAGYVDEGSLFETRADTPQGGVISPVIANMALDGLEAAVHASAGESERARRKAKLNVIRYADDFVVSGASKDVLESQVLPAIRRFMAGGGRETWGEKNRITHIAG